MKKIKLGLSLYPEQESVEEIEEYLRKASNNGFEKIFTSLFSVDGTREEIVEYFRKLTKIAHEFGMEVDGDVNFAFLDQMGATPDDLSVFKQMGIDTLRLDMPYGDERDAQIVNNKEGIRIEFNTDMVDVIRKAIRNGANPKNISTCYNFYPQRYSAPSYKEVRITSEAMKDLPIAMFINSHAPNTHGPWPVWDGLCTLEEDRDLPVDTQLKHMAAIGDVDEVLIGNAFASDEELEQLARTRNDLYIQFDRPRKQKSKDAMQDAVMSWLPKGEIFRLPLKVELEKDLSDLERSMIFDFPAHQVSADSVNYLYRSRLPRFFAKGKTIEPRACPKDFFEKGDVVVVNDNCRHYAGEVQIVRRPFRNDGQRNLAGHIAEEEMLLLDFLKASDYFSFVEKEQN